MAVVRGILAVLIGTAVALILGAAYEYIKWINTVDPNQWKGLWPWFFAVPGAASAIIAVVLNNIWNRKGTTKSAAAKPTKPALRTKTTPKATTTSKDVPGMPTFDLEELKGDDKKTENLG